MYIDHNLSQHIIPFDFIWFVDATFVEQHHTRMRPCSALFPDILPIEYICHELGTTDGPHKKTQAQLHTAPMKE
jgi:hypothetical protein